MSKPDEIPQDVWDAALDAAGPLHAFADVVERIARTILAAKAEEREAIQALLAREAPHSPRRYIYDSTADRRIWACDQLDADIRKRGEG